MIVAPACVLLLRATRRYYDGIERQVLRGDQRRIEAAAHAPPPLVLVPVERWDNLARRAIVAALRLSPDVTALHVTEGPLLRQILAWRSERPDRPIAVVLPSLVEARGRETLLHTHRERRLRRALLRDARDVMVVAVPRQLAPPAPRAALRDEEPREPERNEQDSHCDHPRRAARLHSDMPLAGEDR